MKTQKCIAACRRLRDQPAWKLLASRHSQIIIGLLQAHLLDAEQGLPASVFVEVIARDIEDLRGAGEDLPQSAQNYIAEWLRDGYLERRFPAGATEEVYEISSAAAEATRFIVALAEPRSAATESRLAVVIQQLVKLAEQTDTNPETRAAKLLAERERLDRQIEEIRSGHVETLSDSQALERVREIIALADALAGDFRRVRDEFERLNRDLRECLMDDVGSRSEVLDKLFTGVDVIAQSDAGRTFSAFWRLLTDLERSATLDEALDQVLTREFAVQLQSKERRFLLTLTRTLLTQGGLVHDVLRHFAASLKSFVQSRQYLEQRRIVQLLKEAQRAALVLKDSVRATDTVGYTLQLTSSRLTSVSQWSLYDPSMEAAPGGMQDADSPLIGLDAVAELVAQSEIDFRGLRTNIRSVLCEQSQASIAEVMARYPATQGLGSVVGYLALGSRHGVAAGSEEAIEWRGLDDVQRRARIPAIYFLREHVHELA